MSTFPGRMGIATFGPALDFRGNSAGGIKIMEMLSEEQNLRLL
jgi:glutaminase